MACTECGGSGEVYRSCKEAPGYDGPFGKCKKCEEASEEKEDDHEENEI